MFMMTTVYNKGLECVYDKSVDRNIHDTGLHYLQNGFIDSLFLILAW